MSGTGMRDAVENLPGGARDVQPTLYDSAGKPLRSGPQPDQSQTGQFVRFMRDEPLAAALIALIVGYFLGKIT
jgi:hypothetical protein